ncbi:MAG: hypothetical protein DI529_09785 [Chryseobacterium sp.]|nr:MAG: hypothetical protein DI529_09785 [Chryseobacterium sp.]
MKKDNLLSCLFFIYYTIIFDNQQLIKNRLRFQIKLTIVNYYFYLYSAKHRRYIKLITYYASKGIYQL